MEELKKYQKPNLDDALKKDYAHALTNEEFKKTVKKLKIKDSIAYKYTSKIERTMQELENCKNCKSIHMCKNKVEGAVYYPNVAEDSVTFNYVACKYKKAILKEKAEIKSEFFEMPYEIKTAKMSNIDITDAKRVKIIKWLKNSTITLKKAKQKKAYTYMDPLVVVKHI